MSTSSSLSPPTAAMEDCKTVAADCVVISCCCQCLIIQIVIFILLKLPYELVRKTKEYAKKKLRKRKTRDMVERTSPLKGRARNECLELYQERSTRIQLEDFLGGFDCGSCTEEVEKVLEEFSRRGEFAFGSFWGREREGSESFCSSTCIAAKQEFDINNTVKFEIVEIVGSFRYSSNELTKQ